MRAVLSHSGLHESRPRLARDDTVYVCFGFALCAVTIWHAVDPSVWHACVRCIGLARSNSPHASRMAQLAVTTSPMFCRCIVLQASMEVAADRRREVEQLRQQLAGSETVLQGQRGKQLGGACTEACNRKMAQVRNGRPAQKDRAYVVGVWMGFLMRVWVCRVGASSVASSCSCLSGLAFCCSDGTECSVSIAGQVEVQLAGVQPLIDAARTAVGGIKADHINEVWNRLLDVCTCLCIACIAML